MQDGWRASPVPVRVAAALLALQSLLPLVVLPFRLDEIPGQFQVAVLAVALVALVVTQALALGLLRRSAAVWTVVVLLELSVCVPSGRGDLVGLALGLVVLLPLLTPAAVRWAWKDKVGVGDRSSTLDLRRPD